MTRVTVDHLARTIAALTRLARDPVTEPDYYLLAQAIDLLDWLRTETVLQAAAAAHGHGALVATIGGQGHASTVEARLSWPECDDIPDVELRVELTRRYGGQSDPLLASLRKLRRDWRPELAALAGGWERDMLAAASRARQEP